MKVLIAGWFSFPNGHATAGDLLSKDVVCNWIDKAGIPYDVALAPPFSGGVDVRSVPPEDYSHLVFVCGPFERGSLEAELQERFGGCRMIGLNLTMSEPLEEWNPFDLLLERDSSRAVNPDLVFLSEAERVPVVGVCLVEAHPGASTEAAEAAIGRLCASRQAAVVSIDTRLDSENPALRNPAEVESLLATMDLVITTRLHGAVLALKNGVPVIAIDPIAGGGKICRQAGVVGWSTVFKVDELTDEGLQSAFDYCLTPDARAAARNSAEIAVHRLSGVQERVLRALTGADDLEESYRRRRAAATLAAVTASTPSPAAGPLRRLLERLTVKMIPGRLRHRPGFGTDGAATGMRDGDGAP